MKCIVPGCKGDVSESPSKLLRTGCASSAPAHSCGTCGRLYWSSGYPVFNRQNHAAFLEGGVVVNRSTDGREMSRL